VTTKKKKDDEPDVDVPVLATGASGDPEHPDAVLPLGQQRVADAVGEENVATERDVTDRQAEQKVDEK
jgi:hypothetical protein